MRIKGDKYYTPQPIYDWLAGKLQLTNKTIFDPCCGHSHATSETFVTVVSRNGIVENDVDQSVNSYHHFDATSSLIWHHKIGIPDWVITNPPYNKDLLPIVNNALNFSREGVALLLRLSFLEPTKNRRNILTGNFNGKRLKAVYPVNPRPQFDPSKSGTDSCTVAWFIWATDGYELAPFDFCTDWKRDQQ